MYEDLGSLHLNFNSPSSAASISHSDDLIEIMGFKGSVDSLAYPDHDWCCLDKNSDSQFDLVVADQVLEHVKYPQKAFDETYRILVDGGYAVITSCFINPLHPSPDDYWRFTKTGLAHLAEESKFSIVTSGSWGNRIITPIGLLRTKWRGEWNAQIFKMLRKFDNENLAISNWIVVQK